MQPAKPNFRLLIVTQKVDHTDPILGFFHRWIAEFATHCETLTVIGQKVGPHDLPPNVRVVSLGKEDGATYFQQIQRFRKFVGQEQYDAALVHMTPIWVVLGAFAWKKPVYLWYEARGARWPLHIALKMVRKVFSASKAGMPIVTPKSVITGHGIDTTLFAIPSFKPKRIADEIITVGRITPSKHLLEIIRSFEQLPQNMKLAFIGAPITSEDQKLQVEIKQYVKNHHLEHRISFMKSDQINLLPRLLSSNIFLHASTTSLDKAVLEAMACGCIVVSSAAAFKNVLPPECVCTNETMVETVKKVLNMSEAEREALRKELRDIVVEEHSLPRLIDLLVSEMNG